MADTNTTTQTAAMTPLQLLDYQKAQGTQTANVNPTQFTQAPAVVSAKDATTDATNIQAMLNEKTAGQQQQSVNNQAITTQKTADQQAAQDKATKDAQAQSDKEAQVKSTQNQIQQTQGLLDAATGAGYTGTQEIKTDAQGNVIPPATQNAADAYTITPQQIQAYNSNPQAVEQQAIDQGWTSEQISNLKYQSSLAKYSEAAQSAQEDLQQFAQGTFPLTPDQNAQLDATKSQFDALVRQQEQTNKNYENGVRILGAVTGRAEYFPDIAMGEVQSAINSGLAKVADLNSKETQALAQMREGFQSDNFKMVTDAHNMILSIDKEISSNMKDVHDSIVAAQKDARDFNYKITQDNIQNTLNSDKFDWQKKMDMVDTQLKQSGLDETKRHNIREEAISTETAAKGTYQIKDNPDGTQSIFNTKTGQVMGSPLNSIQNGQFTDNSISPGNTGIPLLDANTRKTDSGVWYVDGTNLTGASATATQLQAAKLGIPYLGKDGSDAQANIDTARSNMKNINDTMNTFLPSNAFTRAAGVGLMNNLSSLLQTNDAISSFNAYRTAAIQSMRAMAGSKGLRINTAEINAAITNDIPKIDDTIGTAKAKLLKVNSMLDSQERGLYGQNYDIMKIKGTTNSPTDTLKQIGGLNPSYKNQIQQIHVQFPNYTDADILQIFNPNAK